jgi:hypothetical protein
MIPTSIAFVLLLAGALAAGVYLVLRSRRPKLEPMCHFRCPACGQKLRYSANRAGRDALCTRCGRRTTLPSNPQIDGQARPTPAQEAERRAMALRA